MVLESALSWGIGRILDVVFTCDWCGQKEHTKIGNSQKNNLGCKNCWDEIIQFTNACNYTVQGNGEIGHVGAQFLGGYSVNKNPSEKGFFSPSRQGWMYFYMAARARDMLGKQFVVRCEVSDYNTGLVYASYDDIYNPTYNDTRWYDNNFVPVRWTDVPENIRDNRIFAIDLKVKSRLGDVLCHDRRLERLWG